jgi:hypothetical protein
MCFWQAHCFIDRQEFMFKNQHHACDQNTAITAAACAPVSRQKGKGQARILKQGADLACTTVPWRKNVPGTIQLGPHYRGRFWKITISSIQVLTNAPRQGDRLLVRKRRSVGESRVISYMQDMYVLACRRIMSRHFDTGIRDQYYGRC